MFSKSSALVRFFPFLEWFPLRRDILKSDLIAGTTVALVLIPQSMAYAQLAGLPSYYGLYAAFLPVIIAALWGSSHQLTSGPVAMTSLLTASVLAGFAVEGTAHFIELALVLALLVGIIRVLLGVFRIGIIVNFLPYPLIIGFTNAAALIIAFGQLDKLLGVTKIKNGHFLSEVYSVLQMIDHTHFPTLLMGALALGIILVLHKYRPHLPGVLIAVPIAILISWISGFDQTQRIPVDSLRNPAVRQEIETYLAEKARIRKLQFELTESFQQINGETFESTMDESKLRALYERRLLEIRIARMEAENEARHHDLMRRIVSFSEPGRAVQKNWRIVAIKDNHEIEVAQGGKVVGEIPGGLPKLAAPHADVRTVWQLLPGAFVLVLMGFLEVVSIAKFLAAKTRQRFDINQELIGQGLANIAGSFAGSYPVGGSFARSALNFSMGARTGMSSVFAGSIVMIVLLFLTPLFYYLPEAVLAAVIINAVLSLINFTPILEMSKVRPLDALTAVVTFVVTLWYAPRLEIGIYIGAGLAMLFYLIRRTKPRAVLLGRHWDGTLRDAEIYNLPQCPYIAILRFDGSLDYPDVSYFENMVLDIVTSEPKMKFIHVVSDGINFIDASGLEMLRRVYNQLLEMGVQMVFSGLKRQVLEVLAASGFLRTIGRRNIFRTEEEALETIVHRVEDPEFDPARCPLRVRDAQFQLQRIHGIPVVTTETQ